MNGSDWRTCTSNRESNSGWSDRGAECAKELLTRYRIRTFVAVSGTSVSSLVDTS